MPDLLIIPIGGLGRSQLDDIIAAVGTLPGCVAAPMPVMNAYAESPPVIWKAIDAMPDRAVFIVAHSLAGPTGRNTANTLIAQGRPVAGLVIIDNVQWFDGDHHTDCQNVLVFRSQHPGFIITEIPGHPSVMVPGTSHNSVPHDPQVIHAITLAVQLAQAKVVV
jgi:hypothetical protein